MSFAGTHWLRNGCIVTTDEVEKRRTAEAQLEVLFDRSGSHEQLAAIVYDRPLAAPLVDHELPVPRDSVLQRTAHMNSADRRRDDRKALHHAVWIGRQSCTC